MGVLSYQLLGIHRRLLDFYDDGREREFMEENRHLNLSSFRVVVIIAFCVHLIYTVKDLLWTPDDSVLLRAVGLLPILAIILGLSFARRTWDSNVSQKYVSIVVCYIVTIQSLLATLTENPGYTQISHSMPIIFYGAFLFSGIKFRNLVLFLAPITFLVPMIIMWTMLPYPFWNKVDVTIILIINLTMAIFSKYYLELFQRWKFVEARNQKKVQDMIVEINNEVEYQKDLYHGLANRSDDVITVTDLDGNIEYISPSCMKLFGYSQTEMNQVNSRDIIYPEDLPRWVDGAENAQPGESFEVEWRIRDREGNEKWVQTIGIPIMGENDKVRSIQAHTRDISEKKELEARKQEAMDKLKELNNQKSRFFSIISHDLRGPFNNVVSLSSLLRQECENGDRDEALKYIELLNTSSSNASQLLNNLLTWSKNQLDGSSVNPSKLILSNAVDESFSLLKLIAQQKKISLINEIDNGQSVYADVDMITTVIRNVVSNGIKFTNESGEIRAKCELNGNESVVITISDNGVGIPEERLDDLFRIDQKKTTVGTNNERGTGLGLVICKDFIELNGGDFWIESKVGEGTDVKFKLPIGA